MLAQAPVARITHVANEIGCLRRCLRILPRDICNYLWRVPPRSRPTRVANEIRWLRGRLFIFPRAGCGERAETDQIVATNDSPNVHAGIADRFDILIDFDQGKTTCVLIW